LKEIAIPQQAIIKGDAKSASIAAASILAKVSRDAVMRALDTRHPGYGFADHKGYPVRAHYNALAQLGACPAHRRSFGPVREVLGLPPLPPWPLASERANATSAPEAKGLLILRRSRFSPSRATPRMSTKASTR
jgi:ribonuclease HII